MSDTKKAAPDGANIENGETEELTNVTANCPAQNSNTNHEKAQVASFLQRGEENAIKRDVLVHLVGCSSVRALQSQIEREREAGALILSTVRNGGGYYLPAAGEKGKREILAFRRTVHRRAINSLRTLKTANRALREVEGQQELAD